MPTESVATRVNAIIENQLCVEASEITPGSSLRDDLGADSLDVVELALCLEEAFDVAPFSDTEGDRMKTVSDVVSVVEKKMKEKEKANVY